MRLKTIFQGDRKKKAFKNWGKKEVGQKNQFFQLHRLNLWDTDVSSEHKENHADIFKAKLGAWGI